MLSTSEVAIGEEAIGTEPPPARWVRLVCLVDAWLRHKRTVASLDRLSERDLRDIGLERGWDGYELNSGLAC